MINNTAGRNRANEGFCGAPESAVLRDRGRGFETQSLSTAYMACGGQIRLRPCSSTEASSENKTLESVLNNDSTIQCKRLRGCSNTDALLTDGIQGVLDLAGKEGGIVVFPAGNYRSGGLLLHSHTEVHLENGASLIGSENPEDYQIFPIPDGVRLHTDMEMVPVYFTERKMSALSIVEH